MTTQHPAAPETETDANGLADLFDRAHDEVVRLCQPGESWRMSIPANPDRDSDLLLSDALTKATALLADLDAARERVRVVEGERDAARAGRHGSWEYICDRLTARAESAEAAHEAEKAARERLVKRMETLAKSWADEAQAGRTGNGHPLLVQTYDGHARALTTLLGGGEAR